MNWDDYFLGICEAVSKKSPCLSRKIGAILVRDKSILSTGYNGPARGIPHCDDYPLHMIDLYGLEKLADYKPGKLIRCDEASKIQILDAICPRKAKGYESGTHLEECPAQHAEENCVSNAARLGVSTIGSTLYMNTSVTPCKNCFSTLINAGIVEIVVMALGPYDQYTDFISKHSNIKVRKFGGA
jgi:dCMP deaminase